MENEVPKEAPPPEVVVPVPQPQPACTGYSQATLTNCSHPQASTPRGCTTDR